MIDPNSGPCNRVGGGKGVGDDIGVATRASAVMISVFMTDVIRILIASVVRVGQPNSLGTDIGSI